MDRRRKVKERKTAPEKNFMFPEEKKNKKINRWSVFKRKNSERSSNRIKKKVMRGLERKL